MSSMRSLVWTILNNSQMEYTYSELYKNYEEIREYVKEDDAVARCLSGMFKDGYLRRVKLSYPETVKRGGKFAYQINALGKMPKKTRTKKTRATQKCDSQLIATKTTTAPAPEKLQSNTVVGVKLINQIVTIYTNYGKIVLNFEEN